MKSKDDIRKAMLKKRDTLTDEEVEAKSRAIFEKLAETKAYKEAENILIYASFLSEVKTDDIILDALSLGKNVFCPKVINRDLGFMKFVRIYDTAELSEGYFGIREPNINENSEIYKPAPNTLIIIPGVAFDKNGNRIGYKGGFYDRFLADNKASHIIALAYSFQIVDEIIPEIHDIPVNEVICE
ncbi:5-formyltetrahydrofolate cyclo-ligase [Butyrivibrio sp. X503]|uniref:5-formyltetrahydrofolate cyclo-ligase n=1 Tax=Butyrivibrio sp. X503 TaxID=2364878 RepID=UPI000EA9FFF8|nr:5-formyltetrahydrofolate cyclo-ligase [Butyrivibrio sp. X503]RKM57282.1 5-formyltetrahydrofolate cyclo-ligase [Butyrivibrio sp. X503]